MIFNIYVITCLVTNKQYVGKTSNINTRLKEHIRNALKHSHNNHHLYNAIKKYGSNNFITKSIYSSKDNEHILNLEKYFIREYDTYQNGYNMTYGGEGIIGYKHSEITKNKISEIKNKNYVKKNHPMYGKHHDKETKLKISNSLRGNILSIDTKEKILKKLCKKKYKITYPSGKIQIVNNLNLFCKQNNLDNSCMYKVAKNIRFNHKKFKVKIL